MRQNQRMLMVTDPMQLQSVVATHEHQRLSDKYRFIPTTDIIKILAKEGWNPIQAQEKKVRRADLEGFQKHVIRFRQDGAAPVNGIFPEVVMTNSHDGGAAFVFMAGLFRLVCTNGLIVSEGMFGSIRVKHVGFQSSQIIGAVERVIEETPRLLDHVEIFQSISLTRDEQYAFAESALNMKFRGEGERVERPVMEYRGSVPYQIGERTFDLNRLLAPVRSDDHPSSLWNTFNVIQEKFTKGANFEDTVKISNIPTDPELARRGYGTRTHISKVRGIKAIDESVRVNRELWGLTEKMARLKVA